MRHSRRLWSPAQYLRSCGTASGYIEQYSASVWALAAQPGSYAGPRAGPGISPVASLKSQEAMGLRPYYSAARFHLALSLGQSVGHPPFPTDLFIWQIPTPCGSYAASRSGGR